MPAGKARDKRFERVVAWIEAPGDVGDDVHHLAVIFQEEAVGDLHGAVLRHAPDIVAPEIKQHQMLRAFLRIGEQILGMAAILLRRCTARTGAGDGAHGHLASRTRTRISGEEQTIWKSPKSR